MSISEQHLHFWVNSEVECLWDDFTIEEGSIKRNIKLDLINEEYYSTLKMAGGVCVATETINGKLTGNVELTDYQPLAIVEAFQRNEYSADDSFGTLMLGRDGTMRGALGMTDVGYSTVESMLRLTIRVQKFLEEKGIIDANPQNDSDNLDIYVGVENGEIVGRILTNTDDIELTTYEK